MKKRMNLKNMVIIILIAILVISYVRQELTMNKIHEDIEAKQTQLNELQDKNKKLQDEVNQSSTDEYIERMARERLGMIKDGEKVITNSDSPQDKQNNSEVKNNQNK
ncbi:septum formation initiator family protein [Clostridium perfringens]|nr:septum formation initiator family protein [Clostridium perfringens]MDM0456802.1 septum formation initiator family protein [Clostridium perfringens]